MKKNAIHFKIAAWSCKHPLYFYTFVLLSFIIFIAAAFFISANWQTSSNIVTGMKPLIPEKNLPNIEGWIPVSDMQLSDGVRCRLYKNDSTSVTNCYKFLDGRWEFHQSF